MADIKSRETLLAELKVFLRAYNRYLDTGDNSLSKDLILFPYTVGGEGIMDQVEIARDLGILSRLASSDLDNEGTNYTLERNPGAYAVVSLTFYADTEPTAGVVIPAATQVQTVGTTFVDAVSFSTISEVSINVADMASYYVYDRDRYEFTVSALCDTIGSTGNVGSGTIVQIIGSVTGIDGVTNLSAANSGLDEEDDDDFKERIRLAKTGRDINTVNGLRKYVRDSGFTDAYPIRVEDSDSEKATGVDVFVVSADSETTSETFTYDAAQFRYYFTNRPVIAVTSVVGSNAGTLVASAYDYNIDRTSEYRRSIYAQDYLILRPDAGLLQGEQITVTYTYQDKVVSVQRQLNLDENNVLTADPLLKRAFPQYLTINATLTLKANVDGPTVRNKVRNALSQYMNSYRIGDDIQKSDLIVIIQTGYGDFPVYSVDAVVINSFYVTDEFGTVRQPVDEVITLTNKEYALYGGATLN